MITITRSLARQLRAIFLRTLNGSARTSASIPLQLIVGQDGLRVRTRSFTASVEYHIPAPQSPDELTVPFNLLTDCEGRTHDPVTIESAGKEHVLAGWTDGGVPQLVRYDRPSKLTDFPELPDQLADNTVDLLDALHAAAQTADADATRYAINMLQLRGNNGQIAATDGRQLLVQSGFSFPWEGNVLVPRRSVFGSKELPRDQPIQIGRSENWVCIRAGSYSFWLAIDPDGRFPDVDRSIAQAADSLATVDISDADADFLTMTLSRLPCDDECNFPVTLDANGSIAVRSRSADTPQPIEVLLTSSRRAGEAIRVSTDRRFLSRAMRLGFRRIHFFAPETPVLCQDDRRSYVWALLSAEGAIPSSENAVRIESPDSQVARRVSPSRTQPIKETHMTKRDATTVKPTAATETNGSQHRQQVLGTTEEMIDAVEQLKTHLRESLTTANEVLSGLKKHHKQAKLVRTTLDSLAQLRAVNN